MRPSRLLGLGVLTVVTVLLAACSTSESGTLNSSEDSTSAGTQPPSESGQVDSGDPSGQAPPVEDPLDPERLLSEPCDLLTSSQRENLDLTEDEFYVDDFGDNVCKWRTTDGDSSVTISAEETFDAGLDDVYARRSGTTYFEPIEINGYPAVFTADLGTPDDGDCQLYVGITDELVAKLFTISPMSSDNDPCAFTQEVGEAMIDTLQG